MLSMKLHWEKIPRNSCQVFLLHSLRSTFSFLVSILYPFVIINHTMSITAFLGPLSPASESSNSRVVLESHDAVDDCCHICVADHRKRAMT